MKQRMNVVFFLSMNVSRHFNPDDDRSPSFWRHFRGTPVEELLGGRGNGVYEVEFGSEDGRLRTINLSRLGRGFDPGLEVLALVGSGKETFVDPSDPELAYLGGQNGRYGTAVVLSSGVRPAKVVKDQPFTNFDGLRAIGMWQEKGQRHYHIVVVPEDADILKPEWPRDEDLSESEADTEVADLEDEALEQDIAQERESHERVGEAYQPRQPIRGGGDPSEMPSGSDYPERGHDFLSR